MAIRDGKVRNREVWATFFQGKGDTAAAYDPAQVKAAKSAGARPQDAVKPTKRFRPPEK